MAYIDWLDHIQSKKRFSNIVVGIGNEPTLWDQSHKDIRVGSLGLEKSSLGYTELWQRTEEAAVAIKSKFPNIKTAGPGSWGWCGFFGSAKDRQDRAGGCTGGADRKSHGNQPLLAWYLKKICEHKQKTGIRLIDYLDIHYYPEQHDFAGKGLRSAGKRFELCGPCTIRAIATRPGSKQISP